MEPVLGGRDDRSVAGSQIGTTYSRNGARPWRTGRLAGLAAGDQVQLLPQWSPSLADGTTGLAEQLGAFQGDAAMEPVLGGRDDAVRADGPVADDGAAMEPVLGGRDDSAASKPPPRNQPAAMEPVLGGRDD